MSTIRITVGGISVALPAPAQPTTTAPARAQQQLREITRRIQPGQASLARRVAELLVGLDRDAQAAVWWRRAAREGDLDAIDYVREFIDPAPAPTTAAEVMAALHDGAGRSVADADPA